MSEPPDVNGYRYGCSPQSPERSLQDGRARPKREGLVKRSSSQLGGPRDSDRGSTRGIEEKREKNEKPW